MENKPIQKQNRTSYHSDIKLSAQLDLLPDYIKSQIPKSTLHSFKNTDYSILFGIDFSNAFKDLDIIKQFAKNQKALKVYKAYNFIKNKLLSIFYQISPINKFKLFKEKIVQVIEKARKYLSLQRVLYYFNLSKHKYYSWLYQIKHKCKDSVFSKCFKVWPNQLTVSEQNKMKALFAKPLFKNWPIASIAHYCLHKNLLSASINTWYKYAKIFNIKLNNHRKRKYDIGIRASKPHKIWHADVTLFRTLDNVKAYIYLIVDNCSRYILNWKVSLKLSGDIRFHTIKNAYNKYIKNKTIKEHEISLLVDGGSENNCTIVDNFLNKDKINLKKIIAQQDIHFSNSIVEAVNKVLKYRFLFHNNIPDITSLEKHLASFIPVYNNIRPHCGLKGLTPKQVLNGVKIDKEKQRTKIKEAISNRIAINTKYSCGLC